MFPRRRPQGRPPARIHSNRLRNVVRRTGRYYKNIRRTYRTSFQNHKKHRVTTFSPYVVCRCNEILRFRQARHSLRYAFCRAYGYAQRLRFLGLRRCRVHRWHLCQRSCLVHTQATRRTDRLRQTSAGRSQRTCICTCRGRR